jgi:glucose-6-phosphate 1-dehydrogenase
MKKPINQIVVIFGASGDLTRRMLVPSLFELHNKNLLPEKFAVLGVGRTPYSDQEFRRVVDEFLPSGIRTKSFTSMLFYQPLEVTREEAYATLKKRLEKLCAQITIEPNFIFYLSVPPSMYAIIPRNLAAAGLNRSEPYFRRLIVEKPFGNDLETARTLNHTLLQFFDENQLYRIDHYLGKETVQNMLVTRFSNGIFEPLWNHNYIQRIEITSAESLGVEKRGGYYDKAGALRDMVQNHLLQLVGLVAMEPPVVVDANALRNEMLKVFQSLRPIRENQVQKNVIRGQYIRSRMKGLEVKGYREEENVNPFSRTETFVAMKFFVDNWRWAGVPFYIRTGKKMPVRVTEVVVYFKQVPHRLFQPGDDAPSENNTLILRIQPDEGILLKIGMKTPGAGFKVQSVNMDFHYTDLSKQELPSAYSRLLLDCMLGDASLYARNDAVEEAWKFVQPILNAWATDPDIPIYGYPAGSWGPESAETLITGGHWRYPFQNLTHDSTFCEL